MQVAGVVRLVGRGGDAEAGAQFVGAPQQDGPALLLVEEVSKEGPLLLQAPRGPVMAVDHQVSLNDLAVGGAVEHELGLVSAVADRLVAMEAGSALAAGSPADVVADPRVIASYLGTDRPVAATPGSAARALLGGDE